MATNQQTAASSSSTLVVDKKTPIMPACIGSTFRALNEAAVTVEVLCRTARVSAEGLERFVIGIDELSTIALAKQKANLQRDYDLLT